VALGVTLALLYIRGASTRRPVVGAIHGLTGAAALGLLILALQRQGQDFQLRADAMGVGYFGIFAAVLFSIALTLGLLIPLLARRLPNVAGAMIAAHASVAITAFVLFLAWASV
jgi:hypothetical protein